MLLFFLKSSLKTFDSGKNQKVSDIAPVSPTESLREIELLNTFIE